MIDALRMYFIIHIIDIVTCGWSATIVTLSLSGGQDVSCGIEVELTREVNTQRLYIIVMAFNLPIGCGDRFSFYSTFQREIPSDENTDLLVTVHKTWQSYYIILLLLSSVYFDSSNLHYVSILSR
jgi:hypothetical protein